METRIHGSLPDLSIKSRRRVAISLMSMFSSRRDLPVHSRFMSRASISRGSQKNQKKYFRSCVNDNDPPLLKCGIPSSVMMKGIGERCADPGTIPFFFVASQPARYTHTAVITRQAARIENLGRSFFIRFLGRWVTSANDQPAFQDLTSVASPLEFARLVTSDSKAQPSNNNRRYENKQPNWQSLQWERAPLL